MGRGRSRDAAVKRPLRDSHSDVPTEVSSRRRAQQTEAFVAVTTPLLACVMGVHTSSSDIPFSDTCSGVHPKTHETKPTGTLLVMSAHPTPMCPRLAQRHGGWMQDTAVGTDTTLGERKYIGSDDAAAMTNEVRAVRQQQMEEVGAAIKIEATFRRHARRRRNKRKASQQMGEADAGVEIEAAFRSHGKRRSHRHKSRSHRGAKAAEGVQAEASGAKKNLAKHKRPSRRSHRHRQPDREVL